MNQTQLRIAAAITLAGLALIFIHICIPTILTLDTGTLAVLALAAAPWLTVFFRTITIPGVGTFESRDRSQGTAEVAEPPAAQISHLEVKAAPILSDSAKKILATLWRYQRQVFGDDKQKRWTFAVNPSSSDYRDYLKGLSELVNLGLVTVSPKTFQCMLTNEGMLFVSQKPEMQQYESIYVF
jgi:hypothetical protein